MARIDLVQALHNTTRRNYIERVTAHDKAECAAIAGQYGKDYWDGARGFGYGGYHYDGRWRPVAERMVERYGLREGDRVLDVGCGKAYLLFEMMQLVPGLSVTGLDISRYAIAHAKPEVKPFLHCGSADALPFADHSFDVVVSLGTLHNLSLPDVHRSFAEIERVGRGPRKYVMVESYRNEREKVNLLYWQLTCRSFHDPEAWEWIASQAGYNGDIGFIYFE